VKPIGGIAASCILIFFALFCEAAQAKSCDDNGKKALLVIVDRISFEDVEGLHGFRQIIDSGSIALMNNRPSGTYSACKAYINIGSGARAEGTASAAAALKADQEVRKLFYSRTGRTVSEGMLVNPNINRLISQNKRGEYGAVAGSLGQFLRNGGRRTAVLGNADCGDNQIRWAASIAMDRNGIADNGVVGSDILIEDGGFPTGRRTDYYKMAILFEELLKSTDFIVVETGDLTRIEENRDMYNEQMYKTHRYDALMRIDEFLCHLKERADSENWLVMLVTPYPSEAGISRGARLTPLVVYGSGFSAGLLTSGTTRRDGIVGSIDIAPTVLEFFGISTYELVGRPLRGVPMAGNLEKVIKINDNTVNTSNFRYPILYNYALFVIFVVLIGLFTILYPGLWDGRLVTVEEFALVTVMLFPVVLLLLPLAGLKTIAGLSAAAVLTAAIAGYAALWYIKDANKMLLFISGITITAIILDIVTGGGMIKSSVLGYDPIIGARYYGIGNEYMGVAAGSAIVACCSLLEQGRAGLKLIAALLCVVVIVIGYPGLGANMGGAITCLLAFGFFMLRIREVPVGIRHAAAIGIIMAAVLAAFLLADMIFLEEQSHLAAAAQGTVRTGPLHILMIVHRKVLMNFKLLRYTFWTKVLITVIAVTGILFYRPVGIFKRVFAKHPYFAKGWSALVVAAASGMAVNDSGVVTSATGSIFFITSMLYILLQERRIKRETA
jgi:hypothetical protein